MNTILREQSEIQINAIIEQLNLDEKIALIHGNSPFTVAGIPRLDLPEITMTDGPNGVKYDYSNNWTPANPKRDASTYLPVGINLGSSWNPDLAASYGQTLAKEANARGKNILLGPSLNIIRTPLCGRNFEYLTEDPFLNGKKIVAAFIQGVQSLGVIACAKHYAANNQEFERNSINVEMSDRALHEIYLPGFEACVKEGEVLSVMSAYNRFRGEFCSENSYLLNDILKDKFGFRGCVISDWGAVHDTAKAVFGGLDIEMGTEITLGIGKCEYSDFYFANPLIKMIKDGEIKESDIDDKVRRVLRLHFWLKENKSEICQINTQENQQVALNAALESMVLLKNDQNILPLQSRQIKTKLVVVGENAVRKHGEGGGAAGIMPLYEITPLEGLQKHPSFSDIAIEFVKGYSSIADDDHLTLKREAIEAVKDADMVLFFGGFNHGDISSDATREFDTEFRDKKDIILPYGQNELIAELIQANPSVVGVFFGGSAFEMPFAKDIPAILQVWYPGMEGGKAIAMILSGEVSPSGRLPVTFPVKLNDIAAHSVGEYPGDKGVVRYLDDIFVGYRHFASREIEPLFPFGHGLTYSEFRYGSPEITVADENRKVKLSLEIENTGKYEAGEVIQVYVEHINPPVSRPVRELKAFKKVFLKPREKQNATFIFTEAEFSYYSEDLKKWVFASGKYILHVGKSCNEILHKKEIDLK